MEKQEQTIDALQKEIVQLKRLVLSLSSRVKKLEQDNVRIKHEVRGARANILSLDARTRGG